MVTCWCEQVPRAIRWRTEHDHRERETGLGLDHYGHSSWLGHFHAVQVAVAHIFLAALRLTHPHSVGQDWPATPPSANVRAH